MTKIKKILVPTDFSANSESALKYAAMIATAFGSEITIYHVVALFNDDPANPEAYLKNLQKAISVSEEALDDRQTKLEHKGTLKVKTKVSRAISIADEILNYSKEGSFDLIIIGTHGRAGISRFLMGSVAERIIRHTSCPVISIKDQHGEKDLHSKIKKIIVGVDFSEYSKQALTQAADFAKIFNARLEVMHVIEELLHPSFYATGESSIFDLNPDLYKRSRKVLEDFAHETLAETTDLNVYVMEGRPHAEIVHFADSDQADLIVMATHGLSGLDHFLIGSNSEKVARKSNIPVLILPAYEEPDS